MHLARRLSGKLALHSIVFRNIDTTEGFRTHGYEDKVEDAATYTFVDREHDLSEAVRTQADAPVEVAYRCLIDVTIRHDVIIVRPRYAATCDDYDPREPRMCFDGAFDDRPPDPFAGEVADGTYRWKDGVWSWQAAMRRLEGGGYITPIARQVGLCPQSSLFIVTNKRSRDFSQVSFRSRWVSAIHLSGGGAETPAVMRWSGWESQGRLSTSWTH